MVSAEHSGASLGCDSPCWTSTVKAAVGRVSPPAVLAHLLQLIHSVGPAGLVRGQTWGRGQRHQVPVKEKTEIVRDVTIVFTRTTSVRMSNENTDK